MHAKSQHSEYLVVVVFPPSAHTAEWSLPGYPKQGFPGENTYIRVYACMEKYTITHSLHTTACMHSRERMHCSEVQKYCILVVHILLPPSTYSYGALLVIQRNKYLLHVHVERILLRTNVDHWTK